MFGFGKSRSTEPAVPFNRSFTPSRESATNNFQQETSADGELAREAIDVCRVLHGTGNLPTEVDLRNTWKGREAEYLAGRFASAFHWRTLGDAQSFYDKHKRSRRW